MHLPLLEWTGHPALDPNRQKNKPSSIVLTTFYYTTIIVVVCYFQIAGELLRRYDNCAMLFLFPESSKQAEAEAEDSRNNGSKLQLN